MTNDRTRPSGFVGRFLGSWRLALGELVIVSLGVLIALWADQAMQARQEDAMAVSYLESLRTDVRVDIGALQFSSNQARNRQIADYYNQIGLQIERWIAWGDEGITETYFRELAFVVDPELRIRAGTIDPALLQRFLKASGEEAPSSLVEIQRSSPEIGATRADADRILTQMRTRSNFVILP